MNTLVRFTLAASILLAAGRVSAQEPAPAPPADSTRKHSDRHERHRDLNDNINARYTIESVEITGVREDAIDAGLRADLQALVGARVNDDRLGPLMERLRQAHPGYDVDRRMSRGSQRGQLHLELNLRRNEAARWLHFAPNRSKALFHSDQGWSLVLDAPIGSRDLRVTPGLVLDNGDDLVEEYSGGSIRIESRSIAGERLALSFELSRYESSWKDETLAALSGQPNRPALYEHRTTVAPQVIVALTPHLHVAGGISASDLEPFTALDVSRVASAALFSAGYDQQWRRGESRQSLEAGFWLRAGTGTLNSDFEYERYFGSGRYRHDWRRRTVIMSGLAGHISGSAPLFERFTLGDSATLRGWNKYDITPTGADNVGYGSVEYRDHGLTFFFDAGSVWDQGVEAQLRLATGFGFTHENFFTLLGFPLDADEVRTVFTIGVRF